MSTRVPAPGVPLLLVPLLLTGCATDLSATRTPGSGPRAPGHYAQTTDSATAGCLRNPACYTKLPGEEATIPWLSRAEDAAHAAITLARLLEGADIKLVEQILADCAQKANQKVNNEDEELQGQEPTREQCKKVVRMEGNKEVTRAMELGAKKHEEALNCAREALAGRFAQHVSVEPTYQKDSTTGLWRWVDPEQVKEWLQFGLTSALWGALVPDIVIHASGNPNQLQNVYDFKFPCPSTNSPSWRPSTPDQPHFPKDQGKMYEDALLGGESKPQRVTPKGVQ
ncbi:hypothetical protein [Archangium sp.]|uniref:hypothetical protein n=1 Tax=Archangium sp. TaxID=1872627 RepID=UPI00389AC079